jgi:hypothetical protein
MIQQEACSCPVLNGISPANAILHCVRPTHEHVQDGAHQSQQDDGSNRCPTQAQTLSLFGSQRGFDKLLPGCEEPDLATNLIMIASRTSIGKHKVAYMW